MHPNIVRVKNPERIFFWEYGQIIYRESNKRPRSKEICATKWYTS